MHSGNAPTMTIPDPSMISKWENLFFSLHYSQFYVCRKYATFCDLINLQKTFMIVCGGNRFSQSLKLDCSLKELDCELRRLKIKKKYLEIKTLDF